MSNTFLGSWVYSAILCALLIWPVLGHLRLDGFKASNKDVLSFTVGIFIPVLNLMLCIMLAMFLVHKLWTPSKLKAWLNQDFAYFKQS